MSNSPPADPCLPTGPLVPGCPHSAPPARILPTGERTGGWPGSVPDRPWWAFRLPAPASDRVTKQPIKPRSVRGEVSERLKELVSKTSVRVTPYRGFESPPLRFPPVRTAFFAVLAGCFVRRCHNSVTCRSPTSTPGRLATYRVAPPIKQSRPDGGGAARRATFGEVTMRSAAYSRP